LASNKSWNLAKRSKAVHFDDEQQRAFEILLAGKFVLGFMEDADEDGKLVLGFMEGADEDGSTL
jgi:hypothetical protein